jgi:adenylate cyclase
VSRDAEATFLFADIAGFTALTEAHGDEHAVQLVEEFANAVRAELPHVDGEYVRTVGDALMLRVPDPADAVRLGLWITRDAMSGHQAPSVRVGGNHGSAIERNADYFGTTINVAARVSALAAGGEVLVTGQMAALAPDLEGCSTSRAGGKCCATSRSRSKFSPWFVWTRRPITWRLTPSAGWVVDPDRAIGRLQRDEKAYYFCSLNCAAAFAQHPERYTG